MSQDAFKDFTGIKISWDGEESEYISDAVLSGVSGHTVATDGSGRNLLTYLYPVEILNESPTRTALIYSKNPAAWSIRRGWDIYKGKLTIDFNKGSSRIPAKITYLYEEDGLLETLIEGEDWTYISQPSARVENFTPRRRVQTSKLERPGQQILRNLLISDRRCCQITGTSSAVTLEASHIVPVSKGGGDGTNNALLLRRDLHALFDAGLLRFRLHAGFWIIEIDESVRDDAYLSLKNKRLINSPPRINIYLEHRERIETIA